ncbi:unnamed protein product [Didymodactylos carnosus]|uniref:Major facilitator superfamily (MFS) profile domain-containing protein n=1 Tax=Didymodactylos carnosus TaxID=1234261 RepID=A0A8S2IA22_9BILA|nr:unnamed protein product [Didymodactylos carnosus]CAF3726840.1 unnamed protein product [Didymodactylos carnosus]
MLGLNINGHILFLTRFIRLFSYGFLSVGLLLYLTEVGYSQSQIGVLFTGILIGDLVITLFLTTRADRFGRRNILIVGALLKIGAGLTFAFVDSFAALLLAGTIGIISPTGGEIGPFLAIEQACLTESMNDPEQITKIFGYYNFAGYFAQAFGALSSGYMITMMMNIHGYLALTAYRAVLIGHAVFGGLKLVLYSFLSHSIEPAVQARDLLSAEKNWWFTKFGLHRKTSVTIVTKLSALFTLDAFAGGFVMQTIIVYWFHETYHIDTHLLGLMMMGVNVLAGISALAATPLVHKIGAVNTMVVTHFPSNLFLILVPLMPNQRLAVIMLLIRFCISQMDVPARQTYIATVVDADERSAAGGITNIVRSVGLSLSPLIAGYLLKDPSNTLLFSLPFIISGTLKCLYDILLYLSFRFSAPVSVSITEKK